MNLKEYTPGLYDATIKQAKRDCEANISKLKINSQNIYIDYDVLKSINLYLIPIIQDKKIGFINSQGGIVVEAMYDEIKGAFYRPTNVVAARKDDYWYLLNSNGVQILDNGKRRLLPSLDFGSPLVSICSGKSWKVVDTTTMSEIVQEGKYQLIESFRYGFARVKRDNKYGVINSIGNLVVDTIYEEMYEWVNYHQATTVVRVNKDSEKKIIYLN